MIINQQEYWLDDSAEEVLDHLWEETQIVSFKLFYLFDSKNDEFVKPWLGEFKSNPESFTLFRVNGTSNTSDFRVNGNLKKRKSQNVLSIKISLHYSALIGFLGLLAFTASMAVLFIEKHPDLSPFIFYLPSVVVVFYYGVSLLNDYRKTLKLLNDFLG